MFDKFQKSPLAWLQLMKEKTTLLVAVAGIAFADVLMFVQLGLLDGLYDSATNPHRKLQADLVITNRQVQTLIDLSSFPRTRLQQVLAYDGVESVSPVRVDFAPWRNPETRVGRSILVWGTDPTSPAFALPEHDLEQLQMLDRVIFDGASRPEYGAIAKQFEQQGGLEAQVSERVVRVVGLFKMGASFGADGNIIVSDSTFLNLFPQRQPDQIELGLIEVEPNADLQTVQAQLSAKLPDDVKVLTVPEFVQLEVDYWASQGTGFIFNLGTFVGFIVGIVIVYQILYSNVSEHLPQYATLKAMGYSDRYLFVMLMQEAFVLAVFGFIPSLLLSIGLYQLTYAATLLEIGMKVSRAVVVLLLTFLMCGVSGIVASRKLRAADPADIF